MKKIILLGCALVAAVSLRAQEIVVGADFDMLFDNREYSSCDFSESETIFGVRLAPEVGVAWEGKNRLMVGVEMRQEFGDEESLSDIAPIVYWQFQAPSVEVNAGIFPRKHLIGHYSEAFFDQAVEFYHPLIQGLAINYRSQTSDSYAEFAIDWEGLRSETRREKFRIVADGRWDNGRYYAGGTLMVLHHAKTLIEAPDEGVVDNLLVNPHVGMRAEGRWRFEGRLGYLQALQRDRHTESGWITPKGGELWLSVERWGLKLDNKLYVGENLQPLYGIYGADLFEASTFYGVTDHLYNRTALSYGKNFFHDTLRLDASFVVHYDGAGCGLQQLLKIGVNLEKIFGGAKK